MNKLKLNRLLVLIVGLLTMCVTQVWAATADYTLTPTAGSNNNYDRNCDVTVSGITWNVEGNAQQVPWRLGGKSISKVDRAVYSKTAYASAVSQIDLTVGRASSITVNSLKLVYSTNADFSGSSEIAKSFSANSTITFKPASGNFPANAYYKFVFNVTVSGTSNKFVEFSKVEIYNATAATPCTVTFNAGTNGTCSTSSLTEASAGAGVTLPAATAKTGYRFVGWSTSSTPTSADAGKAGDTYKPSANSTLYAYYVQTHTVNWYVNGSATTVTVDHGADLAIPDDIDTDIDCNGKEFVGWCTNALYSNPTTAPTDMFTAASGTVDADANYYAVFADTDGEETTETFGWEEATTPSNWKLGGTFTRTAANDSYSANSGNYYGLTNSSSSVQYAQKVKVKAFSYYCVRRTTNTNTSIKIETSTNGTSWTEALNTTWSTFKSDGKTYTKIEKTWADPVECYVRVNLVTAAYRQLDDVSITYGDVTYTNYTTTCGPIAYTASAESPTNGSISLSASEHTLTTLEGGETITINLTPNSGYELSSVTVTKAGGGTVDISGTGNTRTFTMPTSNVTVSATFSEIVAYSATVADGISNGSISLSTSAHTLTTLEGGETITITPSPNTGYQTVSIEVKRNSPSKIIYRFYGSAASFNFPMPKYDVTVTAAFATERTITWIADGVEITEGAQSKKIADGTRVVAIPAQPEDCASGKKFMGWTDHEITESTDTKPALYRVAAEFPIVDGSNATYYAVYAESAGSATPTVLMMERLRDKEVTTAQTLDGVTLTAAKSSGSNAPTFAETFGDLRLYASNTITIATSSNMKSISFAVSSAGIKRLASVTASVGSVEVGNTPNYHCIWTGDANSVTFTVGAKADYGTDGSTKAGQLDFDAIIIDYASSTANAYATQCSDQCDWQINYQTGGYGSSWSEGNCFKQVDATEEWHLDDFEMPNTGGNFWVGPGQWGTYSQDVQLTNLKIGKYSGGIIDWSPMEHAVGTLRIYDNSTSTNYFASFLPTYQITWGSSGPWSNLAFAHVSDTKFETEMTYAPEDLSGINYYVGVKNNEGNTNFVMWDDDHKKSLTTSLSDMTGMVAGARGKYRIFEDSSNQNWWCTFIRIYKVSYDGNGGTGSMADVYSDVNVNTLANAFTAPTGMQFDGWATSPTGDVVYTVDAEIDLATIQADVDLYAHWAPKNYTLTWDYDGGSVSGSSPDYTHAGTVAYGTTIVAPVVEKQGYTFKTWTPSNPTTMPAENITYKATWAASTNTPYTIKYYKQNLADDAYTFVESEDAIGTTGAQVKAATKTYTGFDKPSRSAATIAADGSTVVDYYYIRNYYTIKWEANGGIIPAEPAYTSGSVKYETPIVKPANPTRVGYNFKGWSPTPASKVPGDNRTYVAQWEEKQYEDYITACDAIEYPITYVLNNGTNPDDAPSVYTEDDLPLTLPTPTRTGYHFDGWFNNSGCTGSAIAAIAVGTTGEQKFWAKWQANTYNVIYEMNGGTNNAGNIANYTYASSGSFTLLDPTKTGYTFQGWYNAGGTKVKTVQYNVAADQTFTARWNAITYTITYNLDGGTNGANPATYTIESADIALADATKTGYTFDGWYTESTFDNKVTGVAIASGSTGNKEYWAKWSVNNYTFVLDKNGGDTDGSVTFSYGATANSAFTAATRAGYTNDGYWSTESGGTKVLNADGTIANNLSGWVADSKWIQTNQTLKLYTHWTKSTFELTCKKKIFGEDPETCGDIRAINAGTENVEVVLLESCLPDGYHVMDWEVSPSTEIVKDCENRRVTIKTMPSNNVTVTAILAPNVTVTGDVNLVSAVGAELGTAHDAITISIGDLANVAKIRIKYRNNSTGEIWQGDARGSSAFRLKDNDYNVADGGNTNIDVATVYGSETSHTFTITYMPKTGNTTDDYTMIVELLPDETGTYVLASAELPLRGHAIPDRFVIATKIDDVWYALPANMTAAGTYDAVVINVDEVNNLAYGPATIGYLLNTFNADQTMGRLRSTYMDGHLWASTATGATKTNIRNYSTNGTADAYGWDLQTSDYIHYTLQNKGQNAPLKLNSSKKWGMYTSGTTSVQFIPLVEELNVVEWYPTKLLIQSAANCNVTAATVDGASVAGASSVGRGTQLYDVMVSNLADNPTKRLVVTYTYQPDTKRTYTYNAYAEIPVILYGATESVTSSTVLSTLTPAIYNSKEVVVRDGEVLTMNGDNAANTFGKLVVYPTAKVVVPDEKSLTANEVTLQAGIDDIHKGGSNYTENKYGVPELYLGGTLNVTNGLFYNMRVDLDQMYSVAVPSDVALASVKYWDDKAITLGNALYVSAYDGAKRAAGDKAWIYETAWADPKTMKQGIGYTISAEPEIAGQPTSILRMPLGFTSGDTETAKSVQVYAYGDASVSDNNKGWNLVGNPYMSTYTTGSADNELSGKIFLGQLKEEMVNDKWTGKYVFEQDATLRYVTIPNDRGDGYTQKPVKNVSLLPFKNFFVQVSEDGALLFSLDKRQQPAAPSYAAQEMPTEIETGILLSGNGDTDNCGLLIGDFNEAYTIGDDLEKMMGSSLAVYTITGGYRLAFNAMSENYARGVIPVGYQAPEAGVYTFSFDEDYNLDDIQSLYLTDHDLNETVDLTTSDYTFSTASGKNETRFTLSIGLRTTPTGMGDKAGLLQDVDLTPRKFIFQDKMYIQIGDVIYDATGKLVNNK